MTAPQPPLVGDPKFHPGRLVATPNVIRRVSDPEIRSALARHIRGDWGDVDPCDWKANELALITDARLLSSYESREGVKFWVITEADRSSTCILLPEDY